MTSVPGAGSGSTAGAPARSAPVPARPRTDLGLLATARLATVLGSTATTVAVVLVAEPWGAWAVSVLLGAELVAALLTTLPIAQQGHAAGASGHSQAVNSLLVHLVGAVEH